MIIICQDLIGKNHWKGLSVGSKIITMELKKSLKNLYLFHGLSVDDEIKNDFGSYLGLFQKYKKIFNYLKKRMENFICSFIQIWQKKGVWNQETNDKKFAATKQNIFRKKLSKFVNSKIIRIGGHYSTKKILKF